MLNGWKWNGIPVMNSDRNWQTVGWKNIDEYFVLVNENRWQVHFSDIDRVIVRVPLAIGRSETWHVLSRVPNCRTRDWWMQIPRSKTILRATLAEELGIDAAHYIIDGVPIPD